MTEQLYKEISLAFKNHIATKMVDDDRYTIIDWRNTDGSIEYYVNYIVDRKRGSIIVSGDLGACIAIWYNSIKIQDLACWIKNDVGYFISKFSCSTDEFYYPSESVYKDFIYNISDYDNDEIFEAYNECFFEEVNDIDEVYSRIKEEIDNCNIGPKFEPNDYLKEFASLLDPDYYEWLYRCGREIDPRVYFWSEGFYMACKQLNIIQEES